MINLKAKTPERQIWPVISDINWTNGGILQPEDFIERGLTVTFSERMHPDTITLDTFVVTIELPEGDGDGNLIGYRPLIVHGSVVSDKAEDDTQWRFTPAGELVTWISRHLKVLPPEPGLRVRATLKGNAILDAAGERPLDGDVVVKTGEPKGLSLPSGDDCRGGDFESWFYLTVPKSVEGAAQGSDATRSQGSGEALANEGAAQESDFTRIRGVGEALDGRLKAAGVLTFVDLAAKSPEEISRILGLGWSIERINKARLIEHAQQLAREV